MKLYDFLLKKLAAEGRIIHVGDEAVLLFALPAGVADTAAWRPRSGGR